MQDLKISREINKKNRAYVSKLNEICSDYVLTLKEIKSSGFGGGIKYSLEIKKGFKYINLYVGFDTKPKDITESIKAYLNTASHEYCVDVNRILNSYELQKKLQEKLTVNPEQKKVVKI